MGVTAMVSHRFASMVVLASPDTASTLVVEENNQANSATTQYLITYYPNHLSMLEAPRPLYSTYRLAAARGWRVAGFHVKYCRNPTTPQEPSYLIAVGRGTSASAVLPLYPVLAFATSFQRIYDVSSCAVLAGDDVLSLSIGSPYTNPS